MYYAMIYLGLSIISFFVIVYLNSVFNRNEKFDPMYIYIDGIAPSVHVFVASILFPCTFIICLVGGGIKLFYNFFTKLNEQSFLNRLVSNISSFNTKDVPCNVCKSWCNKDYVQENGWCKVERDNVISYFCHKHNPSNNELFYKKYDFENDVYQCEICSVGCKKFILFRHNNMKESLERILICEECLEYFYYNIKKIKNDCLE